MADDCTQSAGPSAAQDRGVVPAGALDNAGRTHGPLTVSAHDHERTRGEVGKVVGELVQLKVPCTGHVACRELAGSASR